MGNPGVLYDDFTVELWDPISARCWHGRILAPVQPDRTAFNRNAT